MRHQLIKVGDDIAQAQLMNGMQVEVIQVTNQGEVSRGEAYDVDESDFKAVAKLKTKAGRVNRADVIIKDIDKENI